MIILKPTSTFKLPFITLDKTIELIQGMKTSNVTGHDSTSIKIYKMLAYRLGPHIKHLINTIILTATYPDILKLSKITPQKKPDKPTDKIDSYRPINNLCTLDKLLNNTSRLTLTITLTRMTLYTNTTMEVGKDMELTQRQDRYNMNY